MLDGNNLDVKNDKDDVDVGKDNDDYTITIAADATLTRGGGLLVCPNSKKLYFYSCDWSHLISFPDSSKIHLFNAALALELFEEYLENYPSSDERTKEDFKGKLVFRTKPLLINPTNNLDAQGESSQSSSALIKQFEHYFAQLKKKLESGPFQGIWKFENGSDNDVEEENGDLMGICKSLCEKNYTFHKSLPDNNGTKTLPFLGYSIENISDSVSAAIAMVSVLVQFPLYSMNLCRVRKVQI